MENRLSSSGITALPILQKTQKDLKDRNIEPEELENRILFKSVFNDIEWTKKGKEENCFSNSQKSQDVCEEVLVRLLQFLHLKDNGFRRLTNGGRFHETRHLVVKSASALSRGILIRKNNRDTTHFNADASNTELLFRTIHSANQLSIYEAVSSWCEEFGRRPNTKQWTSDKFASKN